MSGITTLANTYIQTITPNASATFDVGETSTSTFYTFLNGLRLSGRDISIHHNVPNNDMAFHTNWSSTTNVSILLCTRATSTLSIDGPTCAITCNSDTLNFTSTLNQYKINLWGVNNVGLESLESLEKSG